MNPEQPEFPGMDQVFNLRGEAAPAAAFTHQIEVPPSVIGLPRVSTLTVVSHTVNVRYSCGAYQATCAGKRASCTADARSAAERVAMKAKGLETNYNAPGFKPFEASGITLQEITSGMGGGTYIATWEEAGS